jgi:hypothetical protein
MARDSATIAKLSSMLAQLIDLTNRGQLHWEKQIGSAHRYASWKNNLLILGPAAPISETSIPRYLFVTPLDSPLHVEINSADEQLGTELMQLVQAVENATQNDPETDPFSLTDDVLGRLDTQS